MIKIGVKRQIDKYLMMKKVYAFTILLVLKYAKSGQFHHPLKYVIM
jgi:hypothetical protein